MRLTKKAKDKYISDIGGDCPFCGSGDTNLPNIIIPSENNKAEGEAYCKNCKRKWIEFWVLNNIEEKM